MPQNDTTDTIEVENGNEYPADLYEESSKAVGTQQWVADNWAQMKLPLHTNGVLRTSSRNFKGYQNPDGSGRLKHYRTIEGIRTKSELVISNTECYARGFAHCSMPQAKFCKSKTALPLTALMSRTQNPTQTDLPSVYDIEAVLEPGGEHNGYDRIVVYNEPDTNILASRDKVQTSVVLSDDEADDAYEAMQDD